MAKLFSNAVYPNIVQAPTNFFDVDLSFERHPSTAEPSALWLRIGNSNA